MRGEVTKGQTVTCGSERRIQLIARFDLVSKPLIDPAQKYTNFVGLMCFKVRNPDILLPPPFLKQVTHIKSIAWEI